MESSTPIAHRLTSEMVVIVAAREWGIRCTPRKYYVHKEVIANASPYFGKVFGGKSKDGEIEEVLLEDQDIAVVDLLLQWVYGGGVRKPDPSSPNDILNLVQLYVIANDMSTENLQNEAIDTLRGFFMDHRSVVEELVAYTYKSTTKGSPMRDLLTAVAVDDVTWYPEELELLEGAMKKYGDFAVDFARHSFLRSSAGAKTFAERPACNFHVHQSTKLCGQ